MWGLTPPCPVAASWGARAILSSQGDVDLLHDRQECTGDCTALHAWLAAVGLRRLGALAKSIDVSSEDLFVDRSTGPDGRLYELHANARRSYGYLYIGAWQAPEGALVTRDPRPAPKAKVAAIPGTLRDFRCTRSDGAEVRVCRETEFAIHRWVARVEGRRVARAYGNKQDLLARLGGYLRDYSEGTARDLTVYGVPEGEK